MTKSFSRIIVTANTETSEPIITKTFLDKGLHTDLDSVTYSLSSSHVSANEGDTVTITLTTSGLPNNSDIAYIVTGISSADLSSGSLTGDFEINNNTGSVSFTLANDLTTEGSETLSLSLVNGKASKNVTIGDTSLTPATYSLTSDNSSYNEGDTINITLTTTNVDDGTNIPYTVSGITGADLSSGAISGNFNVSSGTASLSFVLTNDVTTEGTETFTIALNNGEASKSVTINDTSLTKTYSISRNAANINEDGSVVFTLTTENVGDGTAVPFTITGINSSDITAGTLTGNFVISSGSATKSFTMVQDATTEGSETMTLTLDNGLAANSVIINDTSQGPTYSLTSSSESINEGQSVLFTLTTTNVTDGTTIPYTVTGIDVADLVSGSLTGVFTINSNQGTQSYGLVNDTTTEGAETLTLSLDNGAASKNVIINDTSVGVPSYSLARSASNVNEGGAVSFTLTTTNVADGTNIAYTVTGISSSDLTSGSLTGNFVMSSGTATQSFVLAEDASTEGAETMTMALDNGQGGTSSVTVNDTSQAVSYSLGRNAAAIDEGSQVVISLSTTGVSTGTNVAYTVSGIDANDIESDSAPLTGNFTTSGSGTDSKTFKLREDVATEGTETLTLALDNGEAAITVDINDTSTAPTYDLSPSSSTANEGDTITFTLNTTGVSDATMIAYTVTGISSGDLSSGDMTGNFIISSDTATKSFTLANDESTEGSETMTVTIDATGDSASVTINDTSTTPTPSASVKLYLPFDGNYNDGSTFTYAHRFVEQGHGAITAGGVSVSQIMNSGSKYGSGHMKTQIGDRGFYQSSYNDWWTGSSSSDIRLLTYAYTDQSTMPWYPTTNSAYNGRAKSFTIQFWIKFLEVDTSPSHVTTSSVGSHRVFGMGDAGFTTSGNTTWRPWLVCQLQGPASWDSSSEIPYLQIFQYLKSTSTYNSYGSQAQGHVISYSNTNLSRTDWNHVAIQRIAPNPADHTSVTSHQQACTYAVWHNGTRVSTDVAPVGSQELRRIGNSSNSFGGTPHPNRDFGWGHTDTVTPTITGTYSAFSQQPKHIVKFSGSNARGFNLIDDFRYTVGESIYDTSQSSITVPSSALGNTI